MNGINEVHILRMIYKCNRQLFQIKILKTTTLILQNIELHLSKINKSHQLFLLCGGACLVTMNWKMLEWGFPTTFANLEFRPSTWLFVHLSVSVQTFYMTMGIIKLSPSHDSTKYSLKVISCGHSSLRLTSKPSTAHGHQLNGDEIVNAPILLY